MVFRKLGWIGLLVAFGATLGVEAQSLGEVAKREKERQARARATSPPAKVYTEEGSSDGSGSSDSAKGTFTVMDSTPMSERYASEPRPRPVEEPAAPRRSTDTARATGRTGRTVNVTLYVTSWCPYCKRARALLGSLPNLKVTTHDIEVNKSKNAEMLVKTHGDTAIPVIDVEGRVFQGFSRAAIEAMIEDARASR